MKTLVSYLEELGFTKVTRELRLKDVPTWFIFRVTGTDNLYIHRSINPKYYLKKYRMWLNQGTIKNLPKPVGRVVDFDKPIHRRVSLHCIQSDVDMEAIQKDLSRQYTFLEQKVYVRPDITSVMVVRVLADPGYYRIIKYSLPKTRDYALKEFRDRSLGLIEVPSSTRNKRYLEWSRRNVKDIRNMSFEIIDVCVDEEPMIAMGKLAQYVMSTTDTSVNLFMPVF